MPIYEFQCLVCEKKFEKLIRGGEPPRCPACDSDQVRKMMSGFAFRSKSADGTVTASSAKNCSTCSSSSCAGCH